MSYARVVGNGRTYRRRSRHAVRHDTWSGFEPMQHNPWTVEGQIESIGRLARSTNRSRGWRRTAGKVMLLLPWLGVAFVGVVAVVVALVRWLVGS